MPGQVDYYRLSQPLAEALGSLLGRTLEQGERAVVRCPDQESVRALDKALWRLPNPLWLPHGMKSDPDLQPIWLTASQDVPNGARYLFRINGAGFGTAVEGPSFARVFDLFDEAESNVAQARTRWKADRALGCAMNFWSQEKGRWVKSASRPPAP
ncbi:DNA polymerase III subunit chi [Formicincola oecophyllae]|uniref:DNA polymerase III subunit chi n=1 Tax=Formicincola oecophyllae TaxID=2558361 RepID=A0A4Y6UBH3_9PROT|nr:DNA polymerase III subunit chi [Formicincola oecophyllae]